MQAAIPLHCAAIRPKLLNVQYIFIFFESYFVKIF